jgi:hypothetical protein
MNINLTVMDIIHRIVVYFKHDVSQRFCLRLQLGRTQVGPLERAIPSIGLGPTQFGRCKTEIELSHRNMNTGSSQACRSSSKISGIHDGGYEDVAVALVRTDGSQERIASIIRVIRISELGTLAVTSQ